jgi:hypothetical protein
MQVVSVDLEKPAVHLKDGTVMEADLVIGADGERVNYEPFMCNVSESCPRNSLRHPRRRRWRNSNPKYQPFQRL